MTCTCTQSRDSDEYGPSFEGDFVEDFKAVLEEMEQEYDQELFGPDTRARIDHTTKAPFRYICNLERKFKDIGYRSSGSGTLIGPQTVLTAGHCFMRAVTKNSSVVYEKDPRKMRVFLGRNGGKMLDLTAVEDCFPYDNYVPGTATDIGIIRLAKPIGKTGGHWTAAYKKNRGDDRGTSFIRGALPIDVGKLKVNLSGYPLDKPENPTLGCRDLTKPKHLCRESTLFSRLRSAQCGTEQYWTYDLTAKPAGKLLYYFNDTCAGHSGSPVWVTRYPEHRGRVLVGVHIGLAKGWKRNQAVFLGLDVRNWIAKYIK